MKLALFQMKMNASDLQALVEGMHNASTLRAASNASVLMVTNWACRTGTASVSITAHIYECNYLTKIQHAAEHFSFSDIDECEEKVGVCEHGTCNNFQGSFQCVCHSGYSLTPSRSSCVDIDECTRHPNICNNGTCTNLMGSYKCHCHAGFKLSPNNDCIGTFLIVLAFSHRYQRTRALNLFGNRLFTILMTDVDECQSTPYLCRNGRCRNTVGSFRCECADGYLLSPDGQQCRDVNECIEVRGHRLNFESRPTFQKAL